MEFTSNRNFEIALSHPAFADGKKRCVLRFPTDEEWSARSRQQVTVQRHLGRDASKSETPQRDKANSDLFAKIRIDTDGEPFDEAEIASALGRLSLCTLIDCERLGNAYRITLKVPKAEVVHVLKVPSRMQIREYGDGRWSETNRRNQTETRVNLEPAATLWSKLEPSAEGYIGPVPIIHKDVAVTALLLQTAMDDEDDDPEP